MQLSGKTNQALELVAVHSVEKQVVAGMNYKLKVAVKAGDAQQIYLVVVYEQLPANGGGMQLTSYEKMDDAV